MTVWEARDRDKFLKSVGSADDPVALDWMDSAPRELEYIDFTREPKAMRPGDYLVYYAAVHQRLYGIVEVFSKSSMDAQKQRWPYYAQVRPKLVIRDMSRAPSIDVLNVDGGKNFRKTVQQMDYAQLTEAEYERALAAIEDACNESLGDVRDRNFNRVR
jgi:hypothetical protein